MAVHRLSGNSAGGAVRPVINHGTGPMGIQRKALKEYFKNSLSTPLKTKQVAKALGIKGENYKLLQKTLKEMEAEGLLRRVKKNAYLLMDKEDTVVGRLDLVRRNYGFVIPESGGRDIFVKSFNLGEAFDGDRVEVKVTVRGKDSKPEGVILRVLEHGMRRFIGTFEKKGSSMTVIPRDDRLLKEIVIPSRVVKDVKHGDRVVVEIFDWGGPGGKARGKIVKSLEGPKVGPEDEILYKYDFPQRFPAIVLKQSRDVPDQVLESDLDGRMDLRGLTTFTIDPATAEDFDDAVSAVSLPGGETEVGVHIADVSHYVPHGSRLDREAFHRSMSVYLNEAYIPMLPQRLSSGICSLVEGKDRLTMSVLMKIGADGEVLESRPAISVIRSRKRMTYEQAEQVIDGSRKTGSQFAEIAGPLGTLRDLTELRRKRRKTNGYIDLDLPEPEVIRDKDGKPVDIRPKARLFSHLIIEEFMVTANEAVARILSDSGLPSVYRVHDEPERERVENMSYSLSTLASKLNLPKKLWPLKIPVLTGMLDRAAEQGLGDLVSYIVLRSMKRAMYSTMNIGHFGLASGCYTHFTSPIRRYPDLAVHRLLKMQMRGERPGERKLESLEAELNDVSRQGSQREELISKAERESDDRVRAEFMRGFLGERFEARVTSVKPFGMGIRLKRFYVEGFVHISDMSDDYYELDGNVAVLRGTRNNRTFQIGQDIEVILSRSDPELLRIDFVLAEGQGVDDKDIKRKKKGTEKRKGGKGKK